MKLEVGMYVRTETGQIGKITNFDGAMARVDTNKFITYKDFNNEITKASHNIIDLIEVGDYVNGFPVSDIYIDEYIADNDKLKFGDKDLVLSFKSNMDTYYLYTDSIESIVTKEQFEQMQYKVGE